MWPIRELNTDRRRGQTDFISCQFANNKKIVIKLRVLFLKEVVIKLKKTNQE